MVVEGARRAGVSLSVAAIREETDPSIEHEVERLTWVGVGQLGKMIRFFKGEGVEKAIMAGQVRHVQIFSGAVPDARMLKMLLKLPRRNTTSLIGGIAETQEMLDFCGAHGIASDVEVIRMQEINTAYERLLKSDVKYRFVIDMASLNA